MFADAGVQLRAISDLLDDFQKTIDGLEMEYLRATRRIIGGETSAIFIPSGSRALDMKF